MHMQLYLLDEFIIFLVPALQRVASISLIGFLVPFGKTDIIRFRVQLDADLESEA